MQNSAIATCKEDFEEVAILEMSRIGLAGTVLLPGVVLCKGSNCFENLSNACRQGYVSFVRHVFPVQFTTRGNVNVRLAAQMAEIDFSRYSPLSVQVRIFEPGRGIASRSEISADIEKYIAARGGAIQRKDPPFICSIVVIGENAYGGISSATDSLSSWPGGEVRLRKDAQTVSRAERKLLEAFEVFSIDLSNASSALDLGAAPGGWSHVLASRGLRVAAVDPAELDPECLKNPSISHFRKTVQEFLVSYRGNAFSFIANDMRMDAISSCKIMNQAASLVEKGGQAIMTLKLPVLEPRKILAELAKARAILEESYSMGGLRQLFHNRMEVTCWLRTPE